MPSMIVEGTTLAVIDFQVGLLPAMNGADEALLNAKRLVEAARLLSVPIVTTEQNPKRLGDTAPELRFQGTGFSKMTFSASAVPGFEAAISSKKSIVIAGIEAHVCVLQTVIDLLDQKKQVFVVQDAVASRRTESKEAAIHRMTSLGANLVTTEMVVFEWLRSADNPQFKIISRLIR
jgi:nicotinamidase-related amidase